MFGRLLGPLGAAQMLVEGRDAFGQRDKQANPPRLSARDRQAAVRKAFDERDAMKTTQEPDFMKSWTGMGSAAGSLLRKGWDKMQESNAANASQPRQRTLSDLILEGSGGAPASNAAPSPASPVPMPTPSPPAAPWWENKAKEMGTMGTPQPSPGPAIDTGTISPDGKGIVGVGPFASMAQAPQELPPPRPMGSPFGTPMQPEVSYDTPGGSTNNMFNEDLMSKVSSLLSSMFMK